MNQSGSQEQQQSEVVVSLETLNNSSSRRTFLATLVAGAATATSLASAPSSVFASTGLLKHASAAFPKSDADILNFALTLEHLEAAFYETAAQRLGTRGYLGRIIRTLRFDEQQHVAGLTAALQQGGYTPVNRAARYNFPNVFASKNAFLNFAATLEDTGVHAYLGQAPLIKTPSLLLTAASIVTVEARHTGAIRAALHRDPTDGPFDRGSTKEQILAIAGPLIGR